MAKSTPDLLQALCGAFKNMQVVCTESCKTNSHECQEAAQKLDEGYMDAVLPNILENPTNVNADPVLRDNSELGTQETPPDVTTVASKIKIEGESTTVPSPGKSRLSNVHEATPMKVNVVVAEAPKDETNNQVSPKDVQVGAAIEETKTGGVDKGIIGIIVAGMVIVVAGITIKKNWSSIRNRFSSTPRAAERPGASANGTSPEEVPLQDKEKSPV